MLRQSSAKLGRASLLLTLALLAPASARADEAAALQSKLDAAKKKIPQVEFELRYKFQPGEVIKTKVVHVATTETKIQGNTQASKSRSESLKVWRIQSVSPEGNMTFVHSVECVEMWQQISDRPEVRYSSITDKEPPPEYSYIAETVGVPLDTVTIDPQGNVVKRDDDKRHASLGLGDITPPLPTGKVKISHEWSAPDEIFVRMQDGTVKRISIRKHFTLENVQTGVATIQVRTQVLTPVKDPKLQSQLVQQLTNGTIRFDVDAGRLLSRQMDWDETVVGFNGAESMMQYLARFTEEFVEVHREPAKAASSSSPGSNAAARPAGPELRR